MFQDPFASLIPRMTVLDIISEPWAIHRDVLPRARWLERAAELLERVGMEPGHLRRYPHQFSGGQRQRIAIARALLTEAPIMILDEPTSALDPNNERAITHTLNSLKGQRTIILVSHRLSTVVACDQIFMMEHGEILERGTHEELVARRGAYYEMARHQLQIDEADPAPVSPR